MIGKTFEIVRSKLAGGTIDPLILAGYFSVQEAATVLENLVLKPVRALKTKCKIETEGLTDEPGMEEEVAYDPSDQ